MPDESISLLFDMLTPGQALAIMDIVRSHCRIEWVQCVEEETSWDDMRARFMVDRLYDGLVWVRCRGACLSDIYFDILLMIIGRERHGYVVELSFVSSSVARGQWGDLVVSLHSFAENVQRQVGVPLFYAGLDPADDAETRLFTGSEFGPAWFDEDGFHFR